MQAAGMLDHQLAEAGLVEGHLTGRELRHLRLVDVHRPDLVALGCEAGGGDESDPADADDADRLELIFRFGHGGEEYLAAAVP